jgi:hypothetical protein
MLASLWLIKIGDQELIQSYFYMDEPVIIVFCGRNWNI